MKLSTSLMLRRDDGTRVNIFVCLESHGYSNDGSYKYSVTTCKKGKRTWCSTFNGNCYTYRSMTPQAQKLHREAMTLNIVTEAELTQAFNKLHELIRPVDVEPRGC